jgi:predicted NUDIX family phosphoesterase
MADMNIVATHVHTSATRLNCALRCGLIRSIQVRWATPTAMDAVSNWKRLSTGSHQMHYEPAQRVLVVPQAELADLPASGLVAEPAVVKRFSVIIRSQGKLLDRDVAERDREHVQLIALAYIERGRSLLVLPRDETDESHELYGKQAIWVGGHVEAQDCGPWRDHTGTVVANPITDGLRRELEEELGLDATLLSPPEMVGLVRDAGSPRSEMHLGVVYRVRALGGIVQALAEPARMRTPGRCSAELVSLDVLWTQFERLEPWSQFIMRECFPSRPAELMTGITM